MKEIDIVRKLQENGFEAYFVGGCVRDMILRKPPKDVDIVTSATPEEVSKIFETSFFVGESFGISLVSGVEVATFRTESSYDGRKPKSVHFSSSLEEDSNRRDFTFNALYFDPIKDKIIDLHYGIEDLETGTVRFIGKAEDRIMEDYLRILRAIRFASVYGFTLDEEAVSAIKENKHLLHSISAERITAEIKKTGNKFHKFVELLYDLHVIDEIFPYASALKNVPQNAVWHPEKDVWIHTLKVIKNLQTDDFVLNLAGLFHDFGKLTTTKNEDGKITSKGHEADSVMLALPILKMLKVSNKEAEDILWLVENHMKIKHFLEMKKSKRIALAKDERTVKLAELSVADSMTEKALEKNTEIRDAILELRKDEKTFVAPLVSGNDLIALGMKPGKVFKTILDDLFDKQINKGITSKEELLEYVL